MLISKTVMLKWNGRIKQHYVSKGYIYTKMGDTFVCNVNDLTNGSTVKVNVVCDYCGKHFEVMWQHRIKCVNENIVKKDACKDCCELKMQDIVKTKYNVNSVLLSPNIREQITKTNLAKYGCENPFSNKTIQNKIANTNIEKYGCKNVAQSQDIQQKIKRTNQERYGVDCVFSAESIKNKIKETCISKYGAPNYMIYAKHLKLYRGDKSSHWKPVKLQRQNRWDAKYIEWRASVLKRDKFKCMRCNSSKFLQAHHIINWVSQEEYRYDVDNGITLCKDCHTQFHKLYSRSNNTQQQIEEYILQYDEKIC